MNTASLDLCKELYELSGWNDNDKWYCLKNFTTDPEYELEDSPIVADYIPDGNIPAYDLGFLLRKLPQQLALIQTYDNKWQAKWTVPIPVTYVSQPTALIQLGAYFQDADNLEDATAKLAIELFKNGILTK